MRTKRETILSPLDAMVLVAAVIIGTLAVVGMVSAAETEVTIQTASVTTTSQPVTFTSVRQAVVLCSQGTDLTYYKLFSDATTSVDAATSADVPLPAGTAAAPYCHSYSFDGTMSGTGYLHITIIADSGTATVDIVSQ